MKRTVGAFAVITAALRETESVIFGLMSSVRGCVSAVTQRDLGQPKRCKTFSGNGLRYDKSLTGR